jgi:hypothetical protein
MGPGLGKTWFVERAVTGKRPTTLMSMPGAGFETLRYRNAKYQIWDTCESFGRSGLVYGYLRAAHGVFLFFNITDPSAFQSLSKCIRILEEHHAGKPVLLVGAQSDRADDRQISTEEGRQFAVEHGFGYAEASGKTGEGVQEAIAQMHSMLSNLSFSLLWRGSRDGFTAEAFHRCCDGRERTLTVIRDKGGNIFGGFAVPGWESPFFSKRKSDSTSKGFLFTLKNPHNLPPQQFKLIRGQESSAIRVSSKTCACFGNDDLLVCDGCDVKASHTGGFGSTYENTTGIPGGSVFTGSDRFIVSEIEVFMVPSKSGTQ